jgi:hypothetical protein
VALGVAGLVLAAGSAPPGETAAGRPGAPSAEPAKALYAVHLYRIH